MICFTTQRYEFIAIYRKDCHNIIIWNTYIYHTSTRTTMYDKTTDTDNVSLYHQPAGREKQQLKIKENEKINLG